MISPITCAYLPSANQQNVMDQKTIKRAMQQRLKAIQFTWDLQIKMRQARNNLSNALCKEKRFSRKRNENILITTTLANWKKSLYLIAYSDVLLRVNPAIPITLISVNTKTEEREYARGTAHLPCRSYQQ